MLAPAAPPQTGGGSRLASHSDRQLRQLAMSYERTGERLKAAQVYEALIARDDSRIRPLGKRLATIYAQAGRMDAALRWAGKAIEGHPDRVPYLAELHAMAGDHKAAAAMLKKELATEDTVQRKVSLCWQLGATYERAGDTESAEAFLRQAVSAAGDGQHAAAAKRRLERYQASRSGKGTPAAAGIAEGSQPTGAKPPGRGREP
jgi:tetratricopeptide (TPR) repeat protein